MTAKALDNTQAAFMGVERSLLGKRWQQRLPRQNPDTRDGVERTAAAISQTLGVPEILGRILAQRDVSLERAAGFLAPSLKADLPDPSNLRDMDRAAARLADAVEAGEKLAVFGDYDVDGATSSALLYRYFAALGLPLTIYIPDRIREGYGPNAEALCGLHREGVSLVITVDCGIAAFEPLATAAEAGLEVLVVDHHVAEAQLPQAVAVVNPNRLDDDSDCGQMAAVGVTFLLLVALNRSLRGRGFFKDARPEPDLRALLDLVALGTICDVVPLTGVNRALVARGLQVMAQRRNIGLTALADAARLTEVPGVYHAAFLLGPRVNAGGRVGEAPLGAQLLTTDSPAEAAALAARLDGYNQERQAIEKTTLAQAIEAVAAQGLEQDPVIVVGAAGWHPGVIGIVASRLVERYGRPACVIAFDDDSGQAAGKGSARSIAGVDIGGAIIAARHAGLLSGGGGHRMAAGFSLRADGLAAFRRFLAERLGDAVGAAVAQPVLTLDAALSVEAATPDLLQTLEQGGPYGMGNPGPKLVLSDARIAYTRIAGGDHIQLTLVGDTDKRLKAIAFRAVGTPMGEAFLTGKGALFHLAGSLRADNWQGRDDVQFVVDDAAPATV